MPFDPGQSYSAVGTEDKAPAPSFDPDKSYSPVEPSKYSKFMKDQKKAAQKKWDVLGDIGRAAGSSYDAMKSDAREAFPGADTRTAQDQQNRAKYGVVGGFVAGAADDVGRLGSALKLPLDALGVVASPITGTANALLGSAVASGLDLWNPQGIDTKAEADSMVQGALSVARPGAGATAATMAEGAGMRVARVENSLKNRAIDKINERAASDKITAQDVLEAQTKARQTGDKVALVDLGKKNIKGLAGSLLRRPGDAAGTMDRFLDERVTDSQNALKSMVGDLAGGSRFQTQRALATAQSERASPLYDEAFKSNQSVDSKELQKIVETPAGRSAFREAIQTMQNDRTLVGKPDPEKTAAVREAVELGKMEDPATGVGVANGLKLRTWDYVKRALDAQIRRAVKADERDEVRILTGLKGDMVRELDKLDVTGQAGPNSLKPEGGAYVRARQAWGGAAQSDDALEAGASHFTTKKSTEQLAEEFRALSPGDKELYRLSAAESKLDLVKSAADAGDKTKKVINSDKDRERFRMLFDSDAEAQKFIDSVERKRKAFETRQQVKGGSQTAERDAEDASEGVENALRGASALGHAASGNYLGMLREAFRLRRDLGMRNNPELNNELVKMLTDPSLSVSTGGSHLLNRLRAPNMNVLYPPRPVQNTLRMPPFIPPPQQPPNQ